MGREEEVAAADEPREEPSAAPEAGAPGSATETAPEGADAGALSREELVLMLEDARSKADEHWDAVLRSRADLDNLRKRTARDVENAHKYGLERLVEELLPVKDSMELGVAAAEDEATDIHKVREGIELTLKMLGTALGKFGVEEIDPAGERFDPERHQAMTMQEVEGAEPGTVVNVIQKGYLLNGRLVRPAMVVVAK